MFGIHTLLPKKLMRRPLAILPVAAAFLTGCSPLYVLDTLVPSGEYNLTPNVSYGDLPRQKLDIYRPARPDDAAPVIVFFYGGSWKSGERGQYRFVGEALTRRGYTVVVPDYRLYPEVTFPAFMTDAARAVRWVRENINTKAGKSRPLFIGGHSAGAHIAALLATDQRYLNEEGLSPERICGVIGLAGPYVFDPKKYRSTRAVFANLKSSDIARPVKRIAGRTSPFLLLHGESDTTVRASNTTEFAATLREAGNTVQTQIFPGIGHSKILLSISEPFDDIAPVNDRIAAFIAAQASCK
jgi:acetyl esterase/lipase